MLCVVHWKPWHQILELACWCSTASLSRPHQAQEPQDSKPIVVISRGQKSHPGCLLGWAEDVLSLCVLSIPQGAGPQVAAIEWMNFLAWHHVRWFQNEGSLCPVTFIRVFYQVIKPTLSKQMGNSFHSNAGVSKYFTFPYPLAMRDLTSMFLL